MEEALTTPHIGRRLARARLWRQKTQQQLADEIKSSRPTISKLEQSEKVSEEWVAKIADALNLSVDEILNFDDLSPVNYHQYNYEGSSSNYSGLSYCTFNPIERYVELVEANRKLYEELLQAQKEKYSLLEKFLETR